MVCSAEKYSILSENRRYGREKVSCSRKDLFFVTLHCITFIAISAIIAALASTPKDTTAFSEAPFQEARMGKGKFALLLIHYTILAICISML